MFKKVFIAMLFATFLYACGSSEENVEITSEQWQEKIKLMEQSMFNSNDKMFNDSIAVAVIEAYDEFAALFPQDPQTPDFLFKAGEVSLGLGKPLQSMSYFTKVYDKYPTYERASYSLFLQAYVLDNHLHDDVRAGELYTQFMEKFPEHPMAKDAEFSIHNLGKSDEELIKEFEEKNRDKS
jgi:tetratricopeptide (TPR) repeat protein